MYRMIPAVDRFTRFHLKDRALENSLWELKPLKARWKNVKVEVAGRTRHGKLVSPTPDIAGVYCGYLFSPKAWKIVKPMIGVQYELLPVSTSVGDYSVVHFTERLACLDKKKSTIERSYRVKAYAFQNRKLKGQHFFTLPETAGIEVLVSEEFRTLVNEHKLTGVVFEELIMAQGAASEAKTRRSRPRRPKLTRDSDLPNCFLVRFAAPGARKLKSLENVEELLLAAEKDRQRILRLDEAWEMVSFLNNGTVAVPVYKTGFKSKDPSEWALLGGKPLPWPGDGSQEPARLIAPADVARIAKELNRQSKLFDRFDGDDIVTVHHDFWEELKAGEYGYIGLQTADPNKHWKYVLKHFRRLRDFYDAAARAKQAVLIYAESYEE